MTTLKLMEDKEQLQRDLDTARDLNTWYEKRCNWYAQQLTEAQATIKKLEEKIEMYRILFNNLGPDTDFILKEIKRHMDRGK